MKNNINSLFVSYTQARELKELGFDESCFGYFTWMTKELMIECNYENNINSKFEKIKESSVTLLVSAPLKQQVFSWFREKHNLRSYIDTRVSSVDKPFDWIYDYVIKFDDGITTQPFFSGDFETYEQAESECIDKLISLIKNK